jgi:integrase
MSTYKDWTEKTRQTNQELIATMYKRIASEFVKPTLEDIPSVLRYYRDICEQKDTPRTFNLVRSVIHRFIRLKLGKQSEIYQKLTDIEKLSDKPKKPQTAKTPTQIERLTRALPEKYRGMVWTMCTTGVGWKEYGQIEVRADLKNPRVFIDGTKMDRKDMRRKREVPLIIAPTPRIGSEKTFRKVLTTTSKKLRIDNLRIYTFRKCYANWLVEAGVPQWRVEMYMGHQAQTQTQKYQTTEIWRWLSDDADRMRLWLESKRAQSTAGSKAEPLHMTDT